MQLHAAAPSRAVRAAAAPARCCLAPARSLRRAAFRSPAGAAAHPLARRTMLAGGASALASAAAAHRGGAALAATVAAAGTAGAATDLLVVGPGVLGGLAGKLWREAHPGATVVGQTNSTANHDRCAARRRSCEAARSLSLARTLRVGDAGSCEGPPPANPPTIACRSLSISH
jgi:hypothetical protein